MIRRVVNDAAFAVFIVAVLVMIGVAITAGWEQAMLPALAGAAAWLVGRYSIPRPADDEEPVR